jgi:hypothetical protein
MESPNVKADWKKTPLNVFWAEIAPCDHVVQMYEHDEEFLSTLFDFVHHGILSGDSVIIIATQSHLKSLAGKLTLAGMDLANLGVKNLYIPLDAETTLSRFMVNNWPDETLFMDLISGVINRAKGDNRRIRAFGEMVALLWAKEQVGATVRLEQLWNKFCETQALCLFCAYPQSGFTQDAAESVAHICSAHSKMIRSGATHGVNDIYYRVTEQQVG